jgi:PBP1b-binding outer membrane lipoprotein LpoB
MSDIGMIQSGHLALVDRYVGYLTPYATSHNDLDQDTDFQDDVRNAALTLIQAVKDRRSGKLQPADRGLREARPK